MCPAAAPGRLQNPLALVFDKSSDPDEHKARSLKTFGVNASQLSEGNPQAFKIFQETSKW